jgi:hypothetical protein
MSPDLFPTDVGSGAGAGLEGELRSQFELIADVSVEPSVRSALGALREILGVDVAYATRHTLSDQIFETLEGDGASFGIAEGDMLPLELTYCQRILGGELPSIMGDVARHPIAGAMPVTESAGVGAYASVPLRLSDGTLYGTLCCASHEPQPLWQESNARLMQVIARIVADQLERDLLERELHGADLQLTAIDALLAAFAARNSEAVDHSRDLVALAVASARGLGLPEDVVIDVEHVALLHDLGALGGPSESGQRAVVGEQIVAASSPLSHLAPAIRAGYERWDGSGTPDGLAREEIPIASRVVRACKAYQAMTLGLGRAVMSPRDALAELHDGSGSEFDPAVVAAVGVCASLTD